ncbi:MAG: transporter [Bacteroidetes bacterium]|nr:MAG: transporter [Bacteroidota bacterium]
MTDAALLALALLRIEGVGRVTVGRLLRHFPSYEALRGYPREQVLARLKGVRHASDLVHRLFDPDVMAPLLAEAASELAALADRHIAVLTCRDEAWPEGWAALPAGVRPAVFFTYGATEVLRRPVVALMAHPPLDDHAFETAQALVRFLGRSPFLPGTGLTSGFDVVVHKLAVAARHPALLLAPCGLARLPAPMRPAASATVRHGGLLGTPFSLEHGPFPHDERDTLWLLAALARAIVLVDPHPDTAAWDAMTWALASHRPVFGIPGATDTLPEPVHRLRTEEDFDWVRAAVELTP